MRHNCHFFSFHHLYIFNQTLNQLAKTPKNHGKDWTKKDVHQLKDLAKGNTPTGLIAHKLGRTESSVFSKASEESISLKPVNKSPYDRKVSSSRKKK